MSDTPSNIETIGLKTMHLNITDKTEPKQAIYLTKSSVNFGHRLGYFPDDEEFDVVDSIAMMANRASALLYLLSIQFDGSCEVRLSDKLMCSAIDSAIKEIEDINVTIMAFSGA